MLFSSAPTSRSVSRRMDRPSRASAMAVEKPRCPATRNPPSERDRGRVKAQVPWAKIRRAGPFPATERVGAGVKGRFRCRSAVVLVNQAERMRDAVSAYHASDVSSAVEVLSELHTYLDDEASHFAAVRWTWR